MKDTGRPAGSGSHHASRVTHHVSRILGLLLASLALVTCQPAAMAQGNAGPSTEPAGQPEAAGQRDSAEAGQDPGEIRFRRGMREREFGAGYGFKLDLHRFEGRTDVPFYTLFARFGQFQTTRREWIFELPFQIFQEPDETTFGAGTNVILRQHFARGGKIIPFAEIGAGIFFTNIDIRELGGPFQFCLQGGVGLRFALRENQNLVLAPRFYHLSNAGIRSPNTGFNNGLITLGYSVLY